MATSHKLRRVTVEDDWSESGLGRAVAFLGDQVPQEIADSAASRPRLVMSRRLAELNRLVLEADAPAEDFERAAEMLESARGLLARRPTRRPTRWEASALSGKFNALAPPLVVDPGPDPQVFRCRTRLGIGWGGADGVVHGGVVAKIMDMCFGAAGGLNGTPGVTGTLTVRYERPTPLHVELVFESWAERVEGRKVFVAGRVLDGDQTVATATGIMIQARRDSS